MAQYIFCESLITTFDYGFLLNLRYVIHLRYAMYKCIDLSSLLETDNPLLMRSPSLYPSSLIFNLMVFMSRYSHSTDMHRLIPNITIKKTKILLERTIFCVVKLIFIFSNPDFDAAYLFDSFCVDQTKIAYFDIVVLNHNHLHTSYDFFSQFIICEICTCNWYSNLNFQKKLMITYLHVNLPTSLRGSLRKVGMLS